MNFYPRPPRGGRPSSGRNFSFGVLFLSTPSARRATREKSLCMTKLQISIHALREEGDSGVSYPRASPAYFYPRPPRGGRLFVLQKSQIFFDYFYPRPPRGGRREKSRTKFILEKFLSTPSARRATRGCRSRCGKARISIHALREEGDQCRPAYP